VGAKDSFYNQKVIAWLLAGNFALTMERLTLYDFAIHQSTPKGKLMKKIILMTFSALAWTGAQAGPVNLNYVFVSAPPINCVFDTSCITPVSDTTSRIPFPGWPANTPFFLQSRAFDGTSGAPAAGLYGYEYRVDLDVPAKFTGPSGECLYSVTIDFGSIVPMDFDGSGTKNPVYVITEGGIGTIAPDAVLQDGSQVTFVFAAEGDTGLISQMCPGGDSFFIGLVSTQPPTATTAIIDDTNGGYAQFGIGEETVGARVPEADPFRVIDHIIRLVETFPISSWTGTNQGIQGTHRHLTLSLLRDARDLVELGETDTATELLNILLIKVNGQEGNWVQYDPNSGMNEPTLLYENIATALNLLQPGSPIPVIPPGPGGAPGT